VLRAPLVGKTSNEEAPLVEKTSKVLTSSNFLKDYMYTQIFYYIYTRMSADTDNIDLGIFGLFFHVFIRHSSLLPIVVHTWSSDLYITFRGPIGRF